LTGLVGDSSKPEDLLKAGVFLASLGQAGEGMRYLVQAQQKGVEVQAHLELASYPLISELVTRLRKKEYPAAQGVLKRLEEEVGLTEWRTKHQAFLEAMRGVLTTAQREAEAEKLYTEAVELFKQQELHDVKPLVERLQKEYADTTPVLDTACQPPFGDLEKATANLGRRIIVRQDGKGDFTSIQAAIDAAPANSLIEIQDNGVYQEKLRITQEGITLRGKRGNWPMVVSLPPTQPFVILVGIQASNSALADLIIVHKCAPPGTAAMAIDGSNARLRRCMVWPVLSVAGTMEGEAVVTYSLSYSPRPVFLRDSLLLGSGDQMFDAPAELSNCIVTTSVGTGAASLDLRFVQCTIRDPLRCPDGTLVKNSILGESLRSGPNTRVEYCCLAGDPPLIDDVRAGPGCIRANPMFRDPGNLDYRLMPGSPCIGKASDGGDIGVRYTPEMIEMINVALELRRRGIINF